MSAARRVAIQGLLIARTLACALPPSLSLAMAEALGRAWWAVDARRRARARANIAAALGDSVDAHARAHIERAAFAAMLRVPVEVAWFGRLLGSVRQLEANTVREGDWDGFLADVAAGRGGLLLGGHFGNWEVGGHAVRLHGVPLVVVARPLDDARLDALATHHRGGRGGVVGHRGRARHLVGALRRNAWVGLLLDQNAGTSGVFVPFFGMPASTYGAPLRAAQQAGRPVWFGSARRLPGMMRFALRLDRVDVGRPDADRATLEHALAQVNQHLERAVRAAPDQYNWLHRRWKTRPRGEAPDARLPRYDHHAEQQGARSGVG
ncbi:MAG: lysophospholipid acyltransferase family protein [Planctomycetota bacterium]